MLIEMKLQQREFSIVPPTGNRLDEIHENVGYYGYEKATAKKCSIRAGALRSCTGPQNTTSLQ